MIKDKQIDKRLAVAMRRMVNATTQQLPDEVCALIIAAGYHGFLRYAHEVKCWFWWNGVHWEADLAGVVIHAVIRDFVSLILVPALPAMTPYQRAKIMGSGYIGKVEEVMRVLDPFSTSITEFDANPHLVGTPNGVVDLRTGHLRPGQPKDMISLTTGCEIATKGTPSPMWDKFLDWFTCGDKELERFVQKIVGIALIGNNRDHKIFFFHGNTRNGKSAIQRAIALVCGGYHKSAALATFMSKRGMSSDASPGLANIISARVVTGSEVPKGAEWDNQLIKAICSDEPVTLRKLYENMVTMAVRCTPILSGNDLPAFNGLDDAIRERFVAVHCRAKRPEVIVADMGKELFEAEGPQILRWIVEGAVARENEGYTAPDSVKATSQEYFDEEDVLARFINELCEVDDPSATVSSTALYESFQDFVKKMSRGRELSHTMFSIRIQALGFAKSRDRSKRSIFVGLRLRGLDEFMKQ